MSLSEYVHISDKDSVSAIKCEFEKKKINRAKFNDVAKLFGFCRASFERVYDASSPEIFKDVFRGFVGLKSNHDKVSDKFKVVSKNFGEDVSLYMPRAFYIDVFNKLTYGLSRTMDLREITPVVFSKFGENGTPICDIRHTIYGDYVLRLSWMSSQKDFEVDSKHKVVLKSEYYRLIGE